MSFRDVKEYLFKNVVVKLKNGDVFEGNVCGFDDDFDTESGEDEIEIFTGEFQIDIPLSKIQSIEEVSAA